MNCKLLKNETGNVFGLWVVTKLADERYVKNGMAKFEVCCKRCGYKKVYIGNGLRFGHYAHTCENCGARG